MDISTQNSGNEIRDTSFCSKSFIIRNSNSIWSFVSTLWPLISFIINIVT